MDKQPVTPPGRGRRVTHRRDSRGDVLIASRKSTNCPNDCINRLVMGYYYTSEPEAAPGVISCASPKTHTPGSPVKERGHRYYSPSIGRWTARDPQEELERQQVNLVRIFFNDSGFQRSANLLLFVANEPTELIDPLGLMAMPPTRHSLSFCEEAEQTIDTGTADGTLICYKGVLMGCVWSKAKKTWGKYPGIMDCLQKHERTHVRQHHDYKCEPCKIYAPTFEPKVHRHDECQAYLGELKCLIKSQKQDCGTTYDPQKDPSQMTPCEFAYWDVIKNAIGQAGSHCDPGEVK